MILRLPSLIQIKRFFIIFYVVGTLGFILPFSHEIFKWLITPSLILNFALLLLYHQSKIEFRFVFVFLIIFILSFLIEAIGVDTGKIFGNYRYGNMLGIKIMSTPIIIGLNWFLLCYLSMSVTNQIKNPMLQIFLASILMVLYDIVLEQVAPHLDMWYWQYDQVPLQNFLAWFFIALIFNTIIKVSRLVISNPLSIIVYSLQSLFFLLLTIYYNYWI